MWITLLKNTGKTVDRMWIKNTTHIYTKFIHNVKSEKKVS
jgi:hypothetical protein